MRSYVTAGLTVAIVALPLSMAIAVTSGVSPERGLYTAIVSGCLRGWRGCARPFPKNAPSGKLGVGAAP